MYAFEIPGLRFSLPAGAAVAEHRFVSATSTSTAVQATASTPIIGVSMNAVETDAGVKASQQIVEIADGLVIVEAGGEVAAGADVYSDANGKAVGTGTIIAGTALTGAGAAGELITVRVN